MCALLDSSEEKGDVVLLVGPSFINAYLIRPTIYAPNFIVQTTYLVHALGAEVVIYYVVDRCVGAQRRQRDDKKGRCVRVLRRKRVPRCVPESVEASSNVYIAVLPAMTR